MTSTQSIWNVSSQRSALHWIPLTVAVASGLVAACGDRETDQNPQTTPANAGNGTNNAPQSARSGATGRVNAIEGNAGFAGNAKTAELNTNAKSSGAAGRSGIVIETMGTYVPIAGSASVTLVRGVCGDGIRSLLESCDDGNALSGDGCSADCTRLESCGNGALDPGEYCDDGSRGSAACNTDCTRSACGDGRFNPEAGELCDYIETGVRRCQGEPNCDVAAVGRLHCNPSCMCGDSRVQVGLGEQCDDGTAGQPRDTDKCNGNCTFARCGDGYPNQAAGELCDTDGDSAACDSDCTQPGCGDGHVNLAAGEQCDTRGINTLTCTSDCKLVVTSGGSASVGGTLGAGGTAGNAATATTVIVPALGGAPGAPGTATSASGKASIGAAGSTAAGAGTAGTAGSTGAAGSAGTTGVGGTAGITGFACPMSCDDGNACTTDGCQPGVGCIHVSNSDPCDDENACTTEDRCSSGVCTGGAIVNCDDGNVCTADGCFPAIGCVNQPAIGPCNDGNACTTADSCLGGTCVGGPALSCDDGNQCTADSCNSGSGCVHETALDGTECNDGNECTEHDLCNATGECVGQGKVLKAKVRFNPSTHAYVRANFSCGSYDYANNQTNSPKITDERTVLHYDTSTRQLVAEPYPVTVTFTYGNRDVDGTMPYSCSWPDPGHGHCHNAFCSLTGTSIEGYDLPEPEILSGQPFVRVDLNSGYSDHEQDRNTIWTVSATFRVGPVDDLAAFCAATSTPD